MLYFIRKLISYVIFDNFGRDTSYNGIVWDVMCYYCIGSNCNIVTYFYVSKNLYSESKVAIISNDYFIFVFLLIFISKNYTW